MNLREYIQHLLPHGSDAWDIDPDDAPAALTCPTWPADLFAVIGSVIERTGCYTLACPDRDRLNEHAAHLTEIEQMARAWNIALVAPPDALVDRWNVLWEQYGEVDLGRVGEYPALVSILLTLFATADETCVGMGWDVNAEEQEEGARSFAALTMGAMADVELAQAMMPHLPTSLCVRVPSDRVIVLPKSLTPSVGCTIRSLSHYLALLPPCTLIHPTWIWSTTERATQDRPDPKLPYDVRVLLVPFPYSIDASCFRLSTPRATFGVGDTRRLPAYFKLEQHWLAAADGPLTGQRLAEELIIPLVKRAYFHSGQMPDGIVLPECALTSALAKELVEALEESEINIEFVITGVLDRDEATGKVYNRAQTFVLRKDEGAVKREHNKHHRWRLDSQQAERYALDFDEDDDNSQWWEDIDVGNRQLPFFGLRKDMCITTLICEDLARADPAMNVIRSVGPNLVIALLMDGPQLMTRWPGRYATVLADDPGAAVLSFTSVGMVDRSNWLESRPARSVALWREAGGRTQEIALPTGSLGVLLTLESVKKHQTTLDGRSDDEVSRRLKLRNIVPLFLATPPNWI